MPEVLDFERDFDPKEQAEIMSLAARLQAERGQRATASELERAANEAGIEPRFVNEAIALLENKRSLNPPSVEGIEHRSGGFLTAALLLLSGQFYVAWMVLSETEYAHDGAKSTSLAVAAFLAFALGFVSSARRAFRTAGAALVVGSGVLSMALVGPILLMSIGHMSSNWPVWLLRGLLLELAAFAAGMVLGPALMRLLDSRNRSTPTPPNAPIP